jgi:hypothetical protein
MLPLTTIQGIKTLLLSDRISYRGSEIKALDSILNDLAICEMEYHKAARIRAVPTPPDNEPQAGEG